MQIELDIGSYEDRPGSTFEGIVDHPTAVLNAADPLAAEMAAMPPKQRERRA